MTHEHRTPRHSARLWIDNGRWRFDLEPHTEGKIRYGRGSLSGYGEDWRDCLADIQPTDRAIVVDARQMDEGEKSTFCIEGPMFDPSVPDGMVHDHTPPELIAFDPVGGTERPERARRLGNAYGLTYVGGDVYVRLARAYGATVIDDPAAVRAFWTGQA